MTMTDVNTSPVAPAPSRWSPKESLLWTLLLLVLLTVIQILPYAILPRFISSLDGEGNGTLACVATGIGDILCIPLLVRIIKRRSPDVVTYLGLRRVSWRTPLPWLIVLAAYVGLVLLVLHMMGKSVTDWVRIQPFKTEPVLWVALIFAVLIAPIFEEMLFRGFLYYGLEGSRLGTRGAVAITALVFGAIHLQYNWYGIAFVVGAGVLFGMARARTGSIIVTMILHSALNLAGTFVE